MGITGFCTRQFQQGVERKLASAGNYPVPKMAADSSGNTRMRDKGLIHQ